ncbi:MAG: hypothetical protein J4473_02115 [Candidatus Aenigmarchaeota archaeon]|nr:hypothetical protein [Candidatus Aenigmarchaeota archaeon]
MSNFNECAVRRNSRQESRKQTETKHPSSTQSSASSPTAQGGWWNWTRDHVNRENIKKIRPVGWTREHVFVPYGSWDEKYQNAYQSGKEYAKKNLPRYAIGLGATAVGAGALYKSYRMAAAGMGIYQAIASGALSAATIAGVYTLGKSRVKNLWNSGTAGKLAVIGGGLLITAGTIYYVDKIWDYAQEHHLINSDHQQVYATNNLPPPGSLMKPEYDADTFGSDFAHGEVTEAPITTQLLGDSHDKYCANFGPDNLSGRAETYINKLVEAGSKYVKTVNHSEMAESVLQHYDKMLSGISGANKQYLISAICDVNDVSSWDELASKDTIKLFTEAAIKNYGNALTGGTR